MEIGEMAENINSKEEFITFLRELQIDYSQNNDDWENVDLERYLGAMEAFLVETTENSINKIDFIPSWSLFAKILIAASIYE